MFFAVEQMLLRSLVVTALIVPGFEGLVQTDQLDDLQESYRQARQQRAELVEEMRQLEDEYETVVDRIDEIKSEGTSEIQNRMSVEQLLSRSREIADRLESHQQRLAKLDERLGTLRGKIVGEIDALTDRIEQQLGDVPADERQELVEQLNALNEIRKQHRAPLPSAPNADEIDETLQMAAQLDSAHPDQIAAAADELEDTEDQVRKRLDAVEEKLDKLQDARTLSRRARTFASEEQFFDEQSRPRVVGRHRESSDSGDEAAAERGDETSAGTSDGTSSRVEAGTGDNTEPDDGTEPDDSYAPSAPDESPGSGQRDQDNFADSSPEASDRAEAARQAPSEPSSDSDQTGGGEETGGGAFDSEDSVVLESDADPSTSVSSGFASDSELEERIEKLEREREKLRRQADELDEKADTLRERADEMKNLD